MHAVRAQPALRFSLPSLFRDRREEAVGDREQQRATPRGGGGGAAHCRRNMAGRGMGNGSSGHGGCPARVEGCGEGVRVG